MDQNQVLRQIIDSDILRDEIKRVIEAEFPIIKGKTWYSSKDAAKYLNITRGTLYNYCSDGKINFSKVGKLSEFNIEDLDSFRENNRK
ncbi:MAG: helix-turn-helix domain-containing protein [Flavobacteriaceae bacterium]|nr:helix-turn-helix domain-containing protein [Flavobacteriaceae bacterium]